MEGGIIKIYFNKNFELVKSSYLSFNMRLYKERNICEKVMNMLNYCLKYGMINNGGGFLMMFGMLLFLVLIGLAIYALIKNINGTSPLAAGNYGDGSNSAIDILNSRYARGEIDEEEYSRKKTALRKL